MMQKSGPFMAGFLLSLPVSLLAQSAVVPKTNPLKVYAHMMPWFQTPETLGGSNWGYHWKMNTRNPNLIDSNGQREIASNYYPLTGPYDSTDSNIIEYQMLLMKLSGIDGVIIDWYGQDGTNGDINSLLTASNAIANSTATYGLQFAAMLEDRFANSTSDVSANINYLRQNYFTKSNYIRTGSNNSPLMPIFGPITYTQPSQWSTIMAGSPGEAIDAVPLWYQSQQLGSYAGGEFSWIYEDAGTNDYLTQQQNFLRYRAPGLSTAMGVAYPGFNDYYQQGGTSTVIPFNPIPSNDGQTLASVLASDAAYSANMDMLQLATWNDYGEGTMFEPTVQTGFTYLMQIQQFTGTPYGLSQLQLVYQLYEERVANAANSAVQTVLNQASSDLNQLDFADSATLLNQFQNQMWNAAGSNNHWSNAANWGNKTIVATNVLVFSGANKLTTSNDFPVQTQFDGFTFAAGAGPFVLGGNSVDLYGDIINNSTNAQTININLTLEKNANMDTAAGDIAINGSISDGLYGPVSVNKLGLHTLTLSGNNSYSGGTTVSGGTLVVGSLTGLGTGPVIIDAGATMRFAGGLHGTAIIPGIAIMNGGTLDLSTTDLLISYAGANPYMSLLASMRSAYDAGRWDLTGILSTSSMLGTTLAIYDNSVDTQSSLDGISAGGSNILIKYTWLGDANDDGVVNDTDLSMISASGSTWQQGDFNYDGRVNADDYSLFYFGLALSDGGNISEQLPEPAQIIVLPFAMWFCRRRRVD
ncbi:MAG TPA: autotransporter-associated beta strand repeat-containing protein [Tepidisphaeraceae bacterium]|nr:autotransporter-associated beta strand repeat-containing protein [Tepidisphaeraceae bacterium]